MGIEKQGGPVGGPAGARKTGSGAPAPTSAEATPLALSALLASEDLLFRDPFADFTPSSR
jgi:hypothetical protein